MKHPIRVVLFDLGNTLMYDRDPWDEFYARGDAALMQSLHQAGLKAGPEMYNGFRGLLDLYYHLRGDDTKEESAAALLRRLLREQGYAEVPEDTIRNALRAMYAETQQNWYPEADALPVLKTLKQDGYRLGLISNASDDENTQTLIDKGGFRPFFEFILSSAALGLRKPHPAIFQAALDFFGVPPHQAVMVGDTPEADIFGAHWAGMTSIWITRRVRMAETPPEVKPDAIVGSLSGIPPLLAD